MASPFENKKKKTLQTSPSTPEPYPNSPDSLAESSHKKKNYFSWKHVSLCTICLLLLLLLSGWLYIHSILGKINRNTSAAISAEDFVEETNDFSDNNTLETLSPEDITLRLANEVLKDKNVINILLIGQDSQGMTSGGRSDSMILATLNQKENEITLTSFMRDLYVDIPGYKKSRLNTSYALGGSELLNDTIERNFGIHIDGSIAVDFSGFAECIDIIGGVELELTSAEADAVNKELFHTLPASEKDADPQADSRLLTEGMQHLSGNAALQYARIRKIDSDFSRTSRQRKLLTAVFEKLKDSDLKTITSLLGEALPLLTTDIPNTKLLGYAACVLTMQPATLKTDRIPTDGAFREAVVHRMQVLVPDLEKNQIHLRESLYGYKETDEESSRDAAAENVKSSRGSKRAEAGASAAKTVPSAAASPEAGSSNLTETTSAPEANSTPPTAGSEDQAGNSYSGITSTPRQNGSSMDSQQSGYQYGPGMPETEAFSNPSDPVAEGSAGESSDDSAGISSGVSADDASRISSEVPADAASGISFEVPTNAAVGNTP